jgi:hypothetical protein
MTKNEVDVIKCSNCSIKWEIIRGESHLKLCQRCRDVKKEWHRNHRIRAPEVIEKDLARRRHKYDTDETHRLQLIATVSTLLKSKVTCSECDKVMNYGSMLPHRKCCKGRDGKTTLQKLLELTLNNVPVD